MIIASPERILSTSCDRRQRLAELVGSVLNLPVDGLEPSPQHESSGARHQTRFLELGGGRSEWLPDRNVDAYGCGERKGRAIQHDFKTVARSEASEGQGRNDHEQGALHPPVEN